MSSEKKRRIWQWTKFEVEQGDKELNDRRILFAVNPPPAVVTLNRDNGQIGGTSFKEKCIKLKPNGVGQYILEPTAEEYESQAQAMERWAEKSKGVVKEITNVKGAVEGTIPDELIPKRPPTARELELEAENARLLELLKEKNKEKK